MPKKETLKKYQKPDILSSVVKLISLYSKRSLKSAADSESLLLAWRPS